MKILRELDEIRDAIRLRRDELNISHETIDNIAGLQSGYTSKLLAPDPIKSFGAMSLPAILGALAIGLVVVEDPEQKQRVESRWQKRKRPQKLHAQGMPTKMQEIPANIDQLMKERISARMREIGAMGNKSPKRRANEQKRRARQRAASHAARKRWSKRHA